MDEPPRAGTPMDQLRELARLRWRENSDRLQRRETWRRMYALFFLSLAATLCVLLVVEIVAQRIAGPTAQQIEKGLSHD
jgi:hypothetical protein